MDEEKKYPEDDTKTPDTAGSSPDDSVDIPDEDEGRPPVDPKNKLYTFLSLLIFAVGYLGYHYIADNFSIEAAYFLESPPAETASLISEEICEGLPEGSKLLYARLHSHFDDNAVYCAFSLPPEIKEPADLEEYIPYEWGDPVRDERFTIFPNANMTPDYVFGDSYVSREDPKIYCVVYENGDSLAAVFRTTEYSRRLQDMLMDGVRINARRGRQEARGRKQE